ncbi:MAG: UDP-glucose 6-dehydrogenase YwqF [Elusimicrobia bacterium]|nr:UDP-glucose 6-dehydrogenase YwqF [Elusimicrobiota bacterium]
MRICTYGLWHLGCVMSAALAKAGFDVIGVDDDPQVISNLNNGRAPLHEPGLDDLLKQQLQSGRLFFSCSLSDALAHADLVWLTLDTPILKNDRADLKTLNQMVARLIPSLNNQRGLLISSQVPVGYCASVETLIKKQVRSLNLPICYSPENLRLGKALHVLENPDRIVAGTRYAKDRSIFEPVLTKLSSRVVWMRPESAEMVKHALNAFLATSVAFANEIAVLCENVGADAQEVCAGLLSESRIGPWAYLRPGSAYAGGTLGRDINFLNQLDHKKKTQSHLIRAVKKSNSFHKLWVKRKVSTLFKNIKGKRFALWGLSYKEGTDTLRGSWSFDLAKWLAAHQAQVVVFDPLIKNIPLSSQKKISLAPNIDETLRDSDCLIVAKDDQTWRNIDPAIFSSMRKKILIDPNGSLRKKMESDQTQVNYFSVGYLIFNGTHGA